MVRVDPIGPTLTDLVERQDYGFGDLAVSPDGRIFLSYQGRVVRVDPVSGLHEMVSGPSRGAGPAFQFPWTPIAPSNQTLVVGDYDLGALVRVDIATGDRSILSGAAVGQGPDLSDVLVWGSEASGAIIATSSGGTLRIDPTSGDRERLLEGSVGAGPLAIAGPGLQSADSLSLGPSGTLFAADGRNLPTALLRVELATGDRSFVPDAGPSDPSLTALRTAESADASGGIIALATQSGVTERVVARVDPATGQRTVISGGGVGSGPLWSSAVDAAVGAGVIFVLDGIGVFAVDPASGDRSVVSDASHGAGETLQGAAALAIGRSGQLFVGSGFGTASAGFVWSVDPSSGDRTRISGGGVGAGAELPGIDRLAVAADGSLLAMFTHSYSYLENPPAAELVRIDPASGDRASLARGAFTALAVVPEPGAGALALAALAALALARWMRVARPAR